ncbi:uncharacterized protein zgc:113149 isoform X1 [Tachysurus fulvidraco]|uniref:uncharacterized protein zgc:113149 isoform X1 n=1 Tax=Tachysurus fulvidraco TaxID=1234273 RepID=UPI001FEE30D6|nr:uncharacterized protein zgc:113149 isoform X1 [Tachysurus fulvidraco]XP_027002289.2 uncharacterized protein zgc:113149 isoform X1 [Tachysurus fulvidraco]
MVNKTLEEGTTRMSEDLFSSIGSSVVSANFKKRKSRFTFSEVQLLLTEVKRNRHILLGKFNQRVSSDVKKRTWAALAARINEISECHREVIEIVKKWSDLKCDTKRKVAAMRASGVSAARITDDLSPVERIVVQILQSGPGEKFPLSDSVADEDEDSQGVSVIPLPVPGTANGRLSVKPQGMPHNSGMISEGVTDLKLDMPCNCLHHVIRCVLFLIGLDDSAVPIADFEPSDTKGHGLGVSKAEYQSDSNKILPEPPSPKRNMIKIETQTKASSNSTDQTESASRASVNCLASHGLGSLREHLAKNASLSLEEQQATTVLIGTLSRSLESVAESVQRLVQTQQEYARDTLRLQRDTLHVLRDFTSSALTLMQDKSKGHP